MFERFNQPKSKIALGLLAGTLALSGCGSKRLAPLPPGAKEPIDYRYEVGIGEAEGFTVFLYTDTKPELLQNNKQTVLSIDGTTFCPKAHKNYLGSEQQSTTYRDDYCSKDTEVYQSYRTVPEERVFIIDRDHGK